MSVTRGELEGLDRETLIARADGAGVAKARILTRQELVDELLLRSATDDATKDRSRGLFGRARDLLARLVERGLNKPEAADRIRSVGRPVVSRPSAPAALPTLTLAEIYVAQGYRERATETLERVLSAEPEHAAARALLTRLRDAAFPVPTPKMPPEVDVDDAKEASLEKQAAPAVGASEAVRPAPAVPAPPAEPSFMLDDSPLPQRYDVDECVAVAMDPRTLYVYWEVRDRTLEELRSQSHGAELAIRVVAVEPAWNAPQTSVRDYEVHSSLGEIFVRDLPPGSVLRAAVGVRSAGERRDFVPVAHSLPVETPQSSPALLAGTHIVRWTASGAFPVTGHEHDGPVASVVASLAALIARLRKDAASASRRQMGPPAAPAAFPVTTSLASPAAQASLASPLAPRAPTLPAVLAEPAVMIGALGASEEFAGGPPYER
jgi:hypothetical protein